MPDLSAYTSWFDSVPMDWFVVLAAVALVTVYALRSGATLPLSLSLALPIALIFLSQLPETFILGTLVSEQGGAVEAGVFLALTVVLTLLIRRMTGITYEDGASPLNAILAGLATAIVLIVVWVQIPALQSLYEFGTQIQSVFGEAHRWWWILAAYMIFAFARR